MRNSKRGTFETRALSLWDRYWRRKYHWLSEAQREASFDKGAYFLGKAIWTKGYRALFDELSGLCDLEGGLEQSDDSCDGRDGRSVARERRASA